MVKRQLCTLEHLMNTEFGRPFPRHGLQLLFWFANHCVNCEFTDVLVIIKSLLPQLVSDCQPENGFYGFHLFGNNEKLLPVLDRTRGPRNQNQVVYFEVGNLNTNAFPAAANLPTYVRENYGFGSHHGNENMDRIIISFQVQTRVVETVYVTEHDGRGRGKFSPNRTYEIRWELILALRNPQLDITTFLSQMGYYTSVQCQQLSGFTEPLNYDPLLHYSVNLPSQNSRVVANYSDVQAIWRPKASRHHYWPTGWEYRYTGFDEHTNQRKGGGGGGGSGGGISLLKILLGAGLLYLAAKCFSWSWSSEQEDVNEKVLRMGPWRTHIMLDYVY